MHMHFSLSYHSLYELECSPYSLKKYLYFQIQLQMKLNHLQLQKKFFKTRAILSNIWWKKPELTATLPWAIKNCQWSLVIAANFVFVMLQTSVSIQTYSKWYSAMIDLLSVLQTLHFDACISNFLRCNQSPHNLAVSTSELWKMLTLPIPHTEVFSSLKSCVLLNSGFPVTWYHHSKPESWSSSQLRRKKMQINKSKPTYLEI